MELICYPRLNLRSKRAILREKNRWGNQVTYRPKTPLVSRLAGELGMSSEQVVEQLTKERQWLLRYRKYFN